MTRISYINISPRTSGFTMAVYHEGALPGDDYAYSNLDDLLDGISDLLEPIKSPPSDEDDGWRVWEGHSKAGAKFPPGVFGDDILEYRMRDGTKTFKDRAGVLDWSHTGGIVDIIAYRVVPVTPPKSADEWIPWDGKGEPKLSKHERVMVRFREGDEYGPMTPDRVVWDRLGSQADITAYKILGADL